MAVSKKDRQIIFNKCNGRCAYCGEELHKGWHVDHIYPIIRNWKTVGGYYRYKDSKLKIEDMREVVEKDVAEWFPYKKVPNGCQYPERDCIENMLPSCASCNINKHGAGIEEFRNLIQGFINSLNNKFVQYKIAKRYGLLVETPKLIVFYFETLTQLKE